MTLQQHAADAWLRAMRAYKDGDLIGAGKWLAEAQAYATGQDIAPRFSPAYLTHLASAKWAAFRLHCLVAADFRCQQCGAVPQDGNPLDIHHRHYRTLGQERPEDVQVLCRACHAAHHQQKEKE